MAIPHAASGEIIDIRPLGRELPSARTTTLIKTRALEVIRLVIPAGKEIPKHQVAGEITVQCLEGRIAFATSGDEQELQAGQMLHLAGNEPHALRGLEDSSALVTIVLQ